MPKKWAISWENKVIDKKGKIKSKKRKLTNKTVINENKLTTTNLIILKLFFLSCLKTNLLNKL